MEELLNQVNTIFQEVFEDTTLTVNNNTTAKDIDSWDSLNHVLLISSIENKFNITFELDEMILFKNVGDIINAIQSKIG